MARKRYDETDEIFGETPEVIEEPVETPVFTAKTKKPVDVDAFIARMLKVINEWPDGARKRAAADRILKNKNK